MLLFCSPRGVGGPCALASQQYHDPLAVISLHHHKQQVKSGGQKGSHDKYRVCAKPDPRRNGQKAERHDRFMDQLRLAHSLGDLGPCM